VVRHRKVLHDVGVLLVEDLTVAEVGQKAVELQAVSFSAMLDAGRRK
jgi:hypothetical protein